MSAQPTLISEAIDSEVLKPSNDNQWQVVRDRAAFPDGKYYAYDKNGNKEQIGGGGNGTSNWPFALTGALDGVPGYVGAFGQGGLAVGPPPVANQRGYLYRGTKDLMIKNLTLKIDSQGMLGGTTITVMKNGVATMMELVVSGTAVLGDEVSDLDPDHWFALLPGDNISLRATQVTVGGVIRTLYATVTAE